MNQLIHQIVHSVFLKNWKWIAIFTLGCLAGNFVVSVLITLLDNIFHSRSIFDHILDLRLNTFIQMGSIPIVIIGFLLEARQLGWERSSLKKIFINPSKSTREDIAYFFIFCSNLYILIAIGLSFSLIWFLRLWLVFNFSSDWLSNISYLKQFIIQFFLGTFLFYWNHRFNHSRFFWEFHKVHHASEEMNLINNFRVHPFTLSSRIFIEVLPPLILGISPQIILLYAGITGVIVVFQHTDLKWNFRFIEKYILIGSMGHLIHHSKSEKHYDKNMGILVLWDWLFGTWLSPRINEPIQIGVDDPDHIFNSGNVIYEILAVYKNGIQMLISKIIKTNR